MISRWQSWWGRPGWERFLHVTAAFTFCLAVGGFLKLEHEVAGGEHLALENTLMQSMRRDGAPLGGESVAAVVRDLTALGSAAVLVVLSLMILGFLLLSRRFRVAGLVAAAIAGGELLNTLLKNAVDRARPDETLHLVNVTSTSFPSGHSMAASIFYLTLGLLLARTAPRRREQIYIISAAIFFTFLVGFSRVYLGVHYPSDVLAGWAAGTAWALLCWFVADWLGRRGALRTETGEAKSDD